MQTLFHPGTLAEIVGRIDHLTSDSTPAWGRMSVGEMVCHLSDYLRVALGHAPAQAIGNALTAALARAVFLRLPLRFPKNARTLPELRRTAPDTLARDVAMLKTLLEEFVSRKQRREWPRNPLFGRLTGAEWAGLVYRHTDHHLRQFRV